MEYILTETEFNELKERQQAELKIETEKLQAICTLAAEHIPVDRYWDKDNKSPWGCILNDESGMYGGYCDECPMDEICPCEHKAWSK